MSNSPAELPPVKLPPRLVPARDLVKALKGRSEHKFGRAKVVERSGGKVRVRRSTNEEPDGEFIPVISSEASVGDDVLIIEPDGGGSYALGTVRQPGAGGEAGYNGNFAKVTSLEGNGIGKSISALEINAAPYGGIGYDGFIKVERLSDAAAMIVFAGRCADIFPAVDDIVELAAGPFGDTEVIRIAQHTFPRKLEYGWSSFSIDSDAHGTADVYATMFSQPSSVSAGDPTWGQPATIDGNLVIPPGVYRLDAAVRIQDDLHTADTSASNGLNIQLAMQNGAGTNQPIWDGVPGESFSGFWHNSAPAHDGTITVPLQAEFIIQVAGEWHPRIKGKLLRVPSSRVVYTLSSAPLAHARLSKVHPPFDMAYRHFGH